MHTRRTRVRRGASPRRSRPARARGSARIRYQPPRRRGSSTRRRPRGRGPQGRRLNIGKSLKTAIATGSLVTAAAAAVLLLAGGGHWFHRGEPAPVPVSGPGSAVGAQLVYTARTANDAAITLPGAVRGGLRQAGLAHQSIELTRVGYTGDVSTSYVDMTPRTGNSVHDPVLRVPGRAVPVIDAKISGIETAVNSPAAAAGGGRALYVGLTRADFTGVPVTIISSGMDLANPDDFRSLDWSVPPADIAAKVEEAGDMPALHGPVTFVMVPTAGPQPQLGQAQKNYLKAVWTALLTAAGATSVTFFDGDVTMAGRAAPSAPTVEVPGLPGTPIMPVHRAGDKVTCTVPASYFTFNTAGLIDAARTKRDLIPCVTAALAAHSTFALDGWTSYEGPLNADGKPAIDDARNRALSDERVKNIANLLVNDLGVPASAITRLTGHGNVGQPDPDPRSSANRVVVITYTTQ